MANGQIDNSEGDDDSDDEDDDDDDDSDDEETPKKVKWDRVVLYWRRFNEFWN